MIIACPRLQNARVTGYNPSHLRSRLHTGCPVLPTAPPPPLLYVTALCSLVESKALEPKVWCCLPNVGVYVLLSGSQPDKDLLHPSPRVGWVTGCKTIWTRTSLTYWHVNPPKEKKGLCLLQQLDFQVSRLSKSGACKSDMGVKADGGNLTCTSHFWDPGVQRQNSCPWKRSSRCNLLVKPWLRPAWKPFFRKSSFSTALTGPLLLTLKTHILKESELAAEEPQNSVASHFQSPLTPFQSS